MKKLPPIYKKPLVQATLIGAFGGMAPKLIELIPKLLDNILPSVGQLLAFILLALIGGVIVLVYKEVNLHKALILGAGAPAILATLTAQAVAPRQAGLFLPFDLSFSATACAQMVSSDSTVRLVIMENESPYSLNRLWLRVDATNINRYQVVGDTVVFEIPGNSNQLRISLPEQAGGVVFQASELLSQKVTHLKISSDRQTKEFWETFGNAKVSGYKIEKAK